MDRRDFLLAGLGGAVTLAASPVAAAAKLHVNKIVVDKSDRKLILLNGSRVIRRFDIKLGFSPVGPKRFQGDGKTPEGLYQIDRRNPQSRYYLSLGVSYPNRQDRAYARSKGRSPGGDIFIHGNPNGRVGRPVGDWTRGCIAVSNSDMDILWKSIPVGTPIDIKA